MSTQPNTLPLQTFTRRAVRSWWADGLWDFAVAGFFFITAGWSYFLVRVNLFPSWTWPWPFQTSEVINPMHDQILLWTIGIVPLVAVYMWLTYQLVSYLKANWLASRQGDVRHAFWIRLETKVLVTYLVAYLGVTVLLAAVFLWLTGSPRYYSALCISAPFAILLSISGTYALPRYRYGALAGLAAGLLTELLLTQPANYQTGPLNFFDVPPQFGNPAIPLLIWAIVFLVSGTVALTRVLALPEGKDLANGEN